MGIGFNEENIPCIQLFMKTWCQFKVVFQCTQEIHQMLEESLLAYLGEGGGHGVSTI